MPQIPDVAARHMVFIQAVRARDEILAAVTTSIYEHKTVRVIFPDHSGLTISPIPRPTTSKPPLKGPRLELAYYDEIQELHLDPDQGPAPADSDEGHPEATVSALRRPGHGGPCGC